MKTRSTLVMTLLVAGALVFTPSAQAVNITGLGYIDLKPYPYTPSAVASGARFLWYPNKFAFRFGESSTPNWDDASIGLDSFGGGKTCLASGEHSFSFNGSATGLDSIAMGRGAGASGQGSIALGAGYLRTDFVWVPSLEFPGEYTGSYVTGMAGFAVASGWGSTALGQGSSATGDSCIALGHASAGGSNSTALNFGSASGYFSLAMQGGVATADNSIAVGPASAFGPHSIALGSSALTAGFGGIAIGRCAHSYYDEQIAIGPNPLSTRKDGTTFDSSVSRPTDPLLSIGRGIPYQSEADTLTVYRDGTLRLYGSLQLPIGKNIEFYDPLQLGAAPLPYITLPTTTGGSFGFTGPVSAASYSLSNDKNGTNGTISSETAGIAITATGTTPNITLNPGTGGNTLLNGNVGIGTTNPISKLSIIDISNSVAGQQIRIGAVAGAADYTIGRNPTTGFLDFTGSQTGFIGYTFSGGNVGIGTSNPVNAKLEISGTSLGDGGGQRNISSFAGNGIRINGSIGGTTQDAITYQSGGGGGAALSFGRGGGYDTFMAFSTNPTSAGVAGATTERMRIAENGNVGIGTTAPTEKLEVTGNVKINGTLTVTGRLATLRVAQQGDLDMGGFTAAP